MALMWFKHGKKEEKKRRKVGEEKKEERVIEVGDAFT